MIIITIMTIVVIRRPSSSGRSSTRVRSRLFSGTSINRFPVVILKRIEEIEKRPFFSVQVKSVVYQSSIDNDRCPFAFTLPPCNDCCLFSMTCRQHSSGTKAILILICWKAQIPEPSNYTNLPSHMSFISGFCHIHFPLDRSRIHPK